MMKVDCFMSLKCSSEHELKINISKALSLEGEKAEVNFFRISDDEAYAKGLKGSPTIYINGKDIEPINLPGFV